MFEQLQPASRDPIIKLMGLFQADERPTKIDVGVGVFRDVHGQTPIMGAVKKAEEKLYDMQTSKAYVGLAGDETFNAEMIKLVFGQPAALERIRAVQTPGGCGALRVLSEMLYRVAEGRTVWVSDPTWGNHYPIFKGSGFDVRAYPYLNRETKAVDFDALMGRLSQLGSADIVVFHACCHNPSGAELAPGQWDEIARLAAKNGFFPYFDMAYQGFGDSLQADACSIRTMAEHTASMAVATSCSKNFGLYRDRVGCAMLVGESPAIADIARDHVLSTARSSYSMPPDHGAAIVAIILTDESLKREWHDELTGMRERMLAIRSRLSQCLHEKSESNQWDFIADHRGMFSLLVLADEEVETLRRDHAVYAVAGGRINIAGLKDDAQVKRFAEALVSVTA